MAKMKDTADIRREYNAGKLSREDLHSDPIQQFERWFKDIRAERVLDPTAMSLATVDENGKPQQRIVLMKGFDSQGFVFFSNLQSHKAKQMQLNSQVSLHFYWPPLDRQISINGTIELLTQADNEAYFSTRPRESQIAAWVSQQSEPISSRQVLEDKYAEISTKFENHDVSLPPSWGGFRVVPSQIEFWQGGLYRLHDRFIYSKLQTDGALPDRADNNDQSAWQIQRLSP